MCGIGTQVMNWRSYRFTKSCPGQGILHWLSEVVCIRYALELAWLPCQHRNAVPACHHALHHTVLNQ